ncbi:MAG: cadherin domain-containing protein, partial [Akkermansiaceae bacterium]|nr:cadherin domain-containing protein [Akkermansiaceae bacterium]
MANEGVIGNSADEDAFRFSSTGGTLSLDIRAVLAHPNLDIKAEILTSTGTPIAAHDPSNSLSAFFSGLYLLEGDYFLRVSGVGRGNLSTGYSDYASLGAYTVTGTINGGVPAERFSVAENSPASTSVGTVTARADHGAGVLSYAILSGNTGNTFQLHPASGEITVNSPILLNFESLSPTWEIPATFELFIQITDSLGVASETLRTVVSVGDVNEAPDFPTPEAVSIPEQVTLGTELTRVAATDPDRGDYVTYSIISGNTGAAFAIDAETGTITTAGPLDFETTPSYALGIRATDHLTPSNSTDAVLAISVLDLGEDLVPGGVMRSVFREIPGSSVESLVIHPRFSGKPHTEEVLPSLDSGGPQGDDYGSTLRAHLIAPVSGTYTFWISADDAAELHLSTDDDPENIVFRASLSSWANRNDFTKYPSQQSAAVSLTAGQSYYLEVRHKESTGGDHVQVAWQPPGTMAPAIIPGKWLVPYQENYAPWANDQTLIVRPAAANGHVVGRLDFVEPDLGETITSYSIISGNESGVFAINPANGNLEVADGGALAQGDVYQITVGATDSGSPALQGTATATIEVVGLHERLHTWWKLDETTGIQVVDASGNGRDAQVSGAANWISRGAANPALELDGTTSSAAYPGSDALAGSTSFTLAAWVRLPSSHASNGMILQQQQSGAGGDIGRYVVQATSTGAVRFSIYGMDAEGGNEGFQFDITSAVTIHDGQWHHVACVRDGAVGRIFIDGVLQATGSGTLRQLDPLHTVAIGKNVRNNSAFLAGTIDDVRIYADALNGVQIMKAAGTPKVAVVSPLAGRADIPPATGLLLEAAASDPDGPAPMLEWLLVSGPGSVTFGSPENEETTAVFSTAGTYTLRINATDGDNVSSSIVQVTAGTTASSQFGGQTIGSGSPGSHFGVGEQFVILTGESSGIEENGTADACYLLGQVFSGDFDVRARITSVSDVGLSSNERAGMMIRAGSTPDAGAVSGFIGLDAAGDLRWIRRPVGSGANLETVVASVMVPEWCRITRSGVTLNFLHSADGISWTSIGTMTLGGELTAGLCWSSGSSGNGGAASFDGIQGFSQSNVGPLVNAGEDAELVAAVPGELLGLVEDDGLPSPGTLSLNWVQVSGTAPVNVASPSSATSAVTCPDEDDYVMRLIADDGAVRTFDDVTLTSTIVNTVSVVATDSDASENGPDPGTMTFIRGGSLIGNLTVNYSLSGSATHGVDYDLIPSSIVIPGGEEEVVVSIAPVDDQVGEGVENVILTLDAGDYQILGNPAEVIISDFNHPPVWSGSPLVWPGAFAGSGYAGPSLATETSDPDGDELFYTKLSGPEWLSIAADGSLSGTPANGDIGLSEFGVRVNDPRGFSADAVLRIQVDFFNVAPVFNGPVTPGSATALFAYEGQTLAAFATDANLVQGDTLTYTKLAGAPWVQVAADGSLTGNPNNDHVGFNFFTVRVTDAGGLFANATVQLIVLPALLHLDANGIEPGSGAPSSATWGSSAVWSLSPAGTAATGPWVDGAAVVFSAGEDAVASSIALDGPRTITAFTVEEGQPTLTGGSLVLAGAPTEFMVSGTCAIESPMSGLDGGLFKTG